MASTLTPIKKSLDGINPMQKQNHIGVAITRVSLTSYRCSEAEMRFIMEVLEGKSAFKSFYEVLARKESCVGGSIYHRQGIV